MIADWLPGVVRALQLAVNASLAGDLPDIRQELVRAIGELRAPETPEDRIVLHSLLEKFASRGARDLHAHLHRSNRPVCTYREDASVFEFFERPGDPRDAFLAWLPFFLADLSRAHPQSKASRVARVLREEYRRAQTLTELARHEHIAPWRLRLMFQREFGVSIPTYREHARVLASLTPLTDPDQKLEVIAAEVGYRSKKNFYRAFTKTTGVTPTAFRRSSPDERLAVVDRVQAVLAGRGRRHPTPLHTTR